jgi:hypothetical protein
VYVGSQPKTISKRGKHPMSLGISSKSLLPLLMLPLSGFVYLSPPAIAGPANVILSPGSLSVSFLGENGGLCSGSDLSAATGSTRCAGLGPDLALGQVSPSFKVQVAAQFGEFIPISPNSSAVATAWASLPIEVEGGTGKGFFEMEIDKVFSNPFNGNTQVSATGGTLSPGMFLGNYNAVIQFQYGVPFTLSIGADTIASSACPYSAISVEPEKYRILEKFPCSDSNCVDISIPIATPEGQSFTLAGLGLLFIAISCARTKSALSPH